jgi:tetratricopeptide (TPR) repeat protein
VAWLLFLENSKMPHLSEGDLEDFIGSMTSNGADGNLPAGLAAHCERCPACAALLEAHRAAARDINRLNRLRTKSTDHACPEMESWLKLSAGLLQGAETEQLLALAAECRNCAESLRAARTYLAEGEPLPALKASDSAWQRQVAVKMKMMSQGQLEKKNKATAWLRYGLAAGMAACLAMIFILWWRNRPVQPDRNALLANAYTEDRRTEMRFPGARWSPLRQVRSNHQASMAAISPLDKAKEALPTICKDQETRDCLLYRAEIDIVAGTYEPALATLDQMRETPEAHDLLLARAMAEFEKANDEPSPNNEAEYSKAAEDLSRALDQAPNDPIALFNRALVFSKLKLINRAAEDLQAFLRIEKEPGWTAEAQGLLDEIQEKKSPGR